MLKKTFVLFFLLPFIIFAQLGEFSLVAPSNYSEDVDVWPLFQWQTSTNATNYLLQISTTPQFYEDTFVSYECGNVTKFRPPVDLIMGGNAYYWRILAFNDIDTLQNNSSQFPYNYWVLQTIPDTEPREVLGSAPLAYNRTLITENTPYTMRQGNLVIPNDKFLKVREGIIIQIEGDYHIEVNGLLQMTGTAENVITITTSDTNKSEGAWENIRFNSGSEETEIDENWNYISGPIFQYVNFEYGGSDQNIIYAPNTSLFINHCRFDNSLRAGMYIGAKSLVSNNEIYAIDNTNTCIKITESGKSKISDNLIEKGYQGISVIGDSSFVMNNKISNSTGNVYGVGISIQGNYIKALYNEISHCTNGRSGGGLYVNGHNLEIKNNIISNCDVSGHGGGVFIKGDYLTFMQNKIDNCHAHHDDKRYTVHNYGGGLYVAGKNEIIVNNDISGCYAYARFSDSDSYDYAYAYGGGTYLKVDSSRILDNQIKNNYCKAYKYSRYSSYAYGGGAFLMGANNSFRNNIVSDNYLADAGGSGTHRYGAGLYISGSTNKATSNHFINNDTQNHLGGGIYVDEENLKIDSCTFSYNKSKDGAGIYINKPGIRIIHSTITNNYASGEGAGIYGGEWIYNSTIKYNVVQDSLSGGGIYGDPDSISYCNINHNYGFQFKKSNSNNTIAIYNWWFTRSDEITIEEDIYDANDTAGLLGFAQYQPFLTDVSPTTPGNFENAVSIFAKSDSSYTNNLNRAISINDTLYFEMKGLDNNKYSRDVAVISAYNRNNWNMVRPFFEETSDSSGKWQGYVIISEKTKLPNKIAASIGDTIDVFVEKDNEVRFSVIIDLLYAPSGFKLLYPQNETFIDSLDIVDFMWKSSFDKNLDSLYYNLNIFSTNFDTTISNIPDTSFSVYFNPMFPDSVIFWSVSVTDGKYMVSSIDTFSFTIPTSTSINENHNKIINTFKLYQNYPNPFNPSTVIYFNLEKKSCVVISVFNSLGQKIKVLLDDELGSGIHKLIFNGSEFATGIYYYQIRAGEHVYVKKMLLLK